jgi:hypothetical protein
MKLKNLATTAACVAALAAGVGAAPAAAKNDKPKNPNHKNGQYKHCDTGSRHFRCVTEDGETMSGRCASDYTVISAITAAVDTDLNGNGFVCYSSALGSYADDKSL